jgi:phage gp36-like protein
MRINARDIDEVAMAAEKPTKLTGVYDKSLDETELTAEEIRDALDRAAARKKALRRYLELAQEIPEVVAVTCCLDDNAVYTVVTTDLWDSEASRRVYDAEVEIMRNWSPAPFEFRMVSLHCSELDDSFYNDHHISSDVVWKR